ncbi:Serine/threonine protein kinase [Anopheles sinensis]|uniref:Serine/threonine protein kinase n=1 Tax=Anopheles sinensis TaxID=74873 RepID=A0A084WAR4_ANOSI|nr:Serine/threonine protein kinase [Anopheles sinensis]
MATFKPKCAYHTSHELRDDNNQTPREDVARQKRVPCRTKLSPLMSCFFVRNNAVNGDDDDNGEDTSSHKTPAISCKCEAQRLPGAKRK